MDLSRLRLGELLAAAAAVALLVALFFDWERDGAASSGGGVPQSGWSSLGWPVLALVLAAVALALTLAVVTAGRRPAAIPIGAAVLTTGVGILVTLVLTVRVLLLDDALGLAGLGLLAMLLIPVGGWVAMADERRQAPYSAPPDVPRRPAPPIEAGS